MRKIDLAECEANGRWCGERDVLALVRIARAALRYVRNEDEDAADENFDALARALEKVEDGRR